MKTIQSAVLILIFAMSFKTLASTPTEALKHTVDQLITSVSDKSQSDEQLKKRISDIVHQAVDFDVVAKRVVSNPWKNASAQQQQTFKQLFADIMVDTYFDLLKNYNNESVEYGNEQVKKEKYAVVDTKVISGDKKIPVRYRLIKQADAWKIYDFVVEGVSLVNSYKNNYRAIIKKDGFDALLQTMQRSKQERESANP